MLTINDKPILLKNVAAVRLAKQRALREGRSAANAASQTIIEALDKNNTNNPGDIQVKSEVQNGAAENH
jgi:hypothetical protein